MKIKFHVKIECVRKHSLRLKSLSPLVIENDFVKSESVRMD